MRSFIARALDVLADEKATDTILLHRFERYAPFPTLAAALRAAGPAHRKCPKYRGLSRLLGMLALDPNLGSLHARRAMAAHNWHPVPVLIHSVSARTDDIHQFDEYTCRGDGLGLHLDVVVLGAFLWVKAQSGILVIWASIIGMIVILAENACI